MNILYILEWKKVSFPDQAFVYNNQSFTPGRKQDLYSQ